MKKLLAIILFIIIVLVVALFIFQRDSTVTLTVQLQNEAPLLTSVTANSEPLQPMGQGEYQGSFTPGDYELVILAPGYMMFSTNLSLSEDVIEVIKLESESPERAVRSFFEDFPSVNIINPQYFGDSSWIAFDITLDNGLTDGTIGVAKYGDNAWEIVYEGTDYDVGDAVFNEAPDELIQYLRGRQ